MATTQIFVKCLNCSCMSGPFQKLSREELELVDKNRTEISYKKGETMCKQGSFISNMMFVKRGLAKKYLEDNQRPILISLATHGAFIGLPSLFDKGIYHYTVEALEDTEVCLVDINVFRSLLKTNAEFASSVLQMVNEKMVLMFGRIQCITNRQINGRFAEILLNLRHEIYHCNPFELTISKKDLADMIYSSQESISRLLKEFKSEGLIRMTGNTLELLDEDKLLTISKVG